ncbi:MAG: iron-sulfur cluster-binding domain-containing protein [Alphaproteobacteria bacterium]
MVSQLSFFKSAHFHFDAERGGFLPVADLVRAAPANAHLYCCGPAPMLEAFERLRRPGATQAASMSNTSCNNTKRRLMGGFLVELARSGQEVVVRRGQTIMQALRDLGVDVPSSCEEGICGACETRVIAGVPDHRDSILSPTERALNKSIFRLLFRQQKPGVWSLICKHLGEPYQNERG